MKSGPTVHLLGKTVVFDENLDPVEPGSGVIGKIARAGDIPQGYYNDPKKTAEVFIEVRGTRYVMPGDYSTVEADGGITLLGRGSIVINSGGEKIFPEEVESAVRSHPDVFDAIVCGARDERWGQTVAAIIEPRPGHEVPHSTRSSSGAGSSWPGTRCLAACTWSTRWSARRRASPTTPGPRTSGRRGGVRLLGSRWGQHSRLPEHQWQFLDAPGCGTVNAFPTASTRPRRARYLDTIPPSCRPFAAAAGPAHRPPLAHAVIATLCAGLALLLSSIAVAAASGPPADQGALRVTAHVDASASWTVYHGNAVGSGNDTSGVSFSSATTAWAAVLDGQVYGEPLEATGRVYVARPRTTRIYALAANTGALLWSSHVGSAGPSGDLPCGDISPTVGITGTPVLDVARGEIFAVADELSGGTPAHALVGLNMYTGTTLMDEDVDPPGQPTSRSCSAPA